MAVKVEGIQELAKALSDKPKKVDKGIKLIVSKYGADLEVCMSDKAPVDTGYLMGSVTLSIKKGGYTAEVEPTAQYASYVEYGTRRMKAQPFVKPSYELIKPRFKQAIKMIVAKGK